MSIHRWHDIPLPEGGVDRFPVFIEIPKGSNVKYELDKETGLLPCFNHKRVTSLMRNEATTSCCSN